MNPDQQPTLEELEEVRDRLVQQIDDTAALDTGNNGHELLTSKSGSKAHSTIG